MSVSPACSIVVYHSNRFIVRKEFPGMPERARAVVVNEPSRAVHMTSIGPKLLIRDVRYHAVSRGIADLERKSLDRRS
jgi:hypothetical protein